MTLARQIDFSNAADVTPGDGDYEIVRSVIETLTLEYQDQPSLEQLAARLDLSPTQLQKTFTRWAGCRPRPFSRR